MTGPNIFWLMITLKNVGNTTHTKIMLIIVSDYVLVRLGRKILSSLNSSSKVMRIICYLFCPQKMVSALLCFLLLKKKQRVAAGVWNHAWLKIPRLRKLIWKKIPFEHKCFRILFTLWIDKHKNLVKVHGNAHANTTLNVSPDYNNIAC